MHSQRQFTPGRKTYSARMINYIALHNDLFPNSQQVKCFCVQGKFDKFINGSDSPSFRVSNNRRISAIVNYSKGGKTQYGNFYLGQPLNVNYLGRMEGMPGGSGSPPVNRF